MKDASRRDLNSNGRESQAGPVEPTDGDGMDIDIAAGGKPI